MKLSISSTKVMYLVGALCTKAMIVLRGSLEGVVDVMLAMYLRNQGETSESGPVGSTSISKARWAPLGVFGIDSSVEKISSTILLRRENTVTQASSSGSPRVVGIPGP